MSLRLLWSAIAWTCLVSSAHAGVIEICKDSDPPGALNGMYNFSIVGQIGTIVVPAGACTEAFVLPDGLATITELGDPDSTLTSVYTYPEERLISFDPQTRSATVLIVPGDLMDPSNQTLLGFVNSPNAPSAVPEPQTVWLVGGSLGLCALYAKKRARIQARFLPLEASRASGGFYGSNAR